MKAVHLDPGERARWLDARIKTLEEGLLAERWVSAEEATSAAAVARTLHHLRRTSGVLEVRAGIRILTGWLAGPPAALIGAITVRDGVGVDLAASGNVRIGLAAEGYAAGLEVGRPRIAVVRGHAWAGSPDVAVVEDERALDEFAVAGIVRWCTPIIEALDPAGRARGPLWAQVADSLGPIAGMLAEVDPHPDPMRWVARVERLLGVRPVPWRHVPKLWTADAGGHPIPVYQRGSCCLFYRSEEPEGRSEIDADFAERFGAGSAQYCGTCRLRDAADVEARTVYWALRARAAETLQSSVQ